MMSILVGSFSTYGRFGRETRPSRMAGYWQSNFMIFVLKCDPIRLAAGNWHLHYLLLLMRLLLLSKALSHYSMVTP